MRRLNREKSQTDFGRQLVGELSETQNEFGWRAETRKMVFKVSDGDGLAACAGEALRRDTEATEGTVANLGRLSQEG